MAHSQQGLLPLCQVKIFTLCTAFGGLFPRELLQHVLQHEQIPKLQKMEQHVKQLSLENRSLERSSRHKCDGRGNI